MTAAFKKGLIWAKPATVAAMIVHAVDKKKNEVYVPAFWWLVMLIIRLLPSSIFKRTKI
jgi:short-subunit dehydrogenase